MTGGHREYVLEVFSDQNFVRDIVKGVLHTIFFHRYFMSIRPSLYTPKSAAPYSSSRTQESLSVPLPAIRDAPEISAAIDHHVAALVSQLTTPSSTGPGAGGSRGEIVMQLFDRKRRKSGMTGGLFGRFGGATQTEDEICWEEWVIQVVVARPRTEADKIKLHNAMESSLQKAAMKIVAIANSDKDHIPPIVTSEQNPFPYKILVNPKQQQGLDRGFGRWT